MATTINASTSSGLVSTADTSGVLQLQTAGTTAVTVDTAQNVGIGTSSPVSALTLANAKGLTWPNASGSFSATAGSQIVKGNDNNLYVDGYDGATVFRGASFTQVLALNKDQTVALQGASLQNGCGITFPATQSASTNANTLDDYEEGTWTPSIGGTATYNTQSGTYVKIGNTVFYTFLLQINVKGTGNNYTVTGFPFSTSGVIRGGPNYYANLPLTITSMIFLGSGAAQIDVYSTTAAANNVTSNTVFGNGADIRGYGFYTT